MVQGMDDKKKGRFTVSSVRWLISGAKREDWCGLTLGAQSRRNTTQNTERTKRHKPYASKQPWPRAPSTHSGSKKYPPRLIAYNLVAPPDSQAPHTAANKAKEREMGSLILTCISFMSWASIILFIAMVADLYFSKSSRSCLFVGIIVFLWSYLKLFLFQKLMMMGEGGGRATNHLQGSISWGWTTSHKSWQSCFQ